MSPNVSYYESDTLLQSALSAKPNDIFRNNSSSGLKPNELRLPNRVIRRSIIASTLHGNKMLNLLSSNENILGNSTSIEQLPLSHSQAPDRLENNSNLPSGRPLIKVFEVAGEDENTPSISKSKEKKKFFNSRSKLMKTKEEQTASEEPEVKDEEKLKAERRRLFEEQMLKEAEGEVHGQTGDVNEESQGEVEPGSSKEVPVQKEGGEEGLRQSVAPCVLRNSLFDGLATLKGHKQEEDEEHKEQEVEEGQEKEDLTVSKEKPKVERTNSSNIGIFWTWEGAKEAEKVPEKEDFEKLDICDVSNEDINEHADPVFKNNLDVEWNMKSDEANIGRSSNRKGSAIEPSKIRKSIGFLQDQEDDDRTQSITHNNQEVFMKAFQTQKIDSHTESSVLKVDGDGCLASQIPMRDITCLEVSGNLIVSKADLEL